MIYLEGREKETKQLNQHKAISAPPSPNLLRKHLREGADCWEPAFLQELPLSHAIEVCNDKSKDIEF